MTQRIMFVTDSARDERLVAALEGLGFVVSTETQSPSAIRALTPPDLIVLNVREGDEALEQLKEIRARSDLQAVSVLVLAEWGDGKSTLALTNGADAFEPKPIDAKRLIAAVDRFLQIGRAHV